jgi:hypothetical protein
MRRKAAAFLFYVCTKAYFVDDDEKALLEAGSRGALFIFPKCGESEFTLGKTSDPIFFNSPPSELTFLARTGSRGSGSACDMSTYDTQLEGH